MGLGGVVRAIGHGIQRLDRAMEMAQLARHFGSNWRDYVDAAGARLAREAEIENRRLSLAEEEAKSRTSDREERAQERKDRERREQAERYLAAAQGAATPSGDGKFLVNLNAIPPELKAAVSPEDAQAYNLLAISGLTRAEAQRLKEKQERAAEKEDAQAQAEKMLRLGHSLSVEAADEAERRRLARPDKPVSYLDAFQQARQANPLASPEELDKAARFIVERANLFTLQKQVDAHARENPDDPLWQTNFLGDAASPPPQGPATRVVNGVTYVKVPGGWKAQ